MEKKIEQAARHLGEAVRYPTISNFDIEKMDLAVFGEFLKFLEITYSNVHRELERTLINGYSPVYHWKGKDSDKLPALFLAHYDVVPALEDGWPHGGPFSGAIEDGKVWGRGSFDNKSSIIGLMETVDTLLEEGFVPSRDVWIAFGFDEEVNGRNGAMKIVEWFKQQEMRFEFVLDEGGAVADGTMMNIKEPVAVIGMAEKANASFEFIFTGAEGHSSTPPVHTSLGHMATFIYKVERNPMPARLTETVEKMLMSIAPYMPGIQSKILKYPRALFPLIKPSLLKGKQTGALLRSTVAFTVSHSGSAPNVLPKEASCTANVRVLQGDTTDIVLKHLKDVSGMEYTVRPIAIEEPSKTASTDTAAYAHLTKTIKANFPEAVITPYLMAGGTDSRHYEEIAGDVYRFQPLRLSEAELALVHGTGEYLSVDNVARMLVFYRQFIETLD
jgi:carboxypeptidase PM20D1